MSTLTLDLVDPASVLVPSTSGTDGPLIDQLRDQCGFVIQGIDWVCRQFGFDLVGAIFDPLAGDYDAVDAMASNWAVLGGGLAVVQANMASMAQALPVVWGGEAAAAAQGRITDFSEGLAVQAEGTALIAAAMQDMLVATKAVMELVAECLSLVDEVVLKVAASALGWAKEIATGGASCRRVISLVNRAIDAIRTLENIVPPLLQACATMGKLMKALRVTFQIASASTSYHNGNRVDDLADAAY